jgi:hypothetical protein
MFKAGKCSEESKRMSQLQGYTRIIGCCSTSWLNPLSSPTIVLALSSIVALMWAFQQQGWSYCIPCIVFIAKKIAKLRWLDLAALAKQAGAFMQVGTGCLVFLPKVDPSHASDVADGPYLFWAMCGKPRSAALGKRITVSPGQFP